MAAIRFEPLGGAFGRAVHGLDLAGGVDDETFRALAEALYAHRVLVLKDQDCDEDVFLAFGRQWGTPIPHVVEAARLPGYPEMLAIGNVTAHAEDDALRNAAAFWHTDQSYDADVATATMLHAIKTPEVGGETRFCDMKAATDGLDEDMRARIDGLVAIHGYGATSGRDGEAKTSLLTEAQKAATPTVSHPLVRRHSVTGEKALYAVAGTAYAIEGMAEAEAEALIADLKAHALQDEYLYEHKYEVGDVTIWDTQMTMHSAKPIGLPDGPGSERLLHRISVRGKPAVFQ